MVEESRSVIFGRDAVAYEDSRPSYPSEVVDHVTALISAETAVEIGAGTGKATEAMARPGLTLTCLEPSPQMAAVLESKHLPGVTVSVTTFEGWEGEAGSLDLVYAAQAWHWVDDETGLDKAWSVLRPGGALALIWNIRLDRIGHHRKAYASHAPHLLAESDDRVRRRDEHDWCADMSAAGFVEVTRFTHSWSDELSSDRYRSLHSTYSDHMMLEEPARTRLLDELAADVERWGGTATIGYRSEVHSGRRPGTDGG